MIIEKLLLGAMPGLSKGHVRMMVVPWYVGQFVMYWAKHERMLADMLSRIRQCDYEVLRDRLLDSQIAAYEKEIRKTIAHLGPLHPSTPYLTAVVEEHVKLRALRNDIVHGFWSALGPDGEFQLKRKSRNAGDIMRVLSLEELEQGWTKLDSLGVTVLNASRAFEGKPIL